MIGVRFTKPVSPYGAGDKAMLPEDVAERVIDTGEAELCQMPDAPHAHGFGEAVAAAPAAQGSSKKRDRMQLPKQAYQTKGLLP